MNACFCEDWNAMQRVSSRQADGLVLIKLERMAETAAQCWLAKQKQKNLSIRLPRADQEILVQEIACYTFIA